jgi:hypothetical protein
MYFIELRINARNQPNRTKPLRVAQLHRVRPLKLDYLCDNRIMPDSKNPDSCAHEPWTDEDEENLLLDVSEDRRLQRLGIDPDGTSLDILIALKKRMAEIEAENLERKKRS